MFHTARLPGALTHQVVAGRAATDTADTAMPIRLLRQSVRHARPPPLALGACRPGAPALDHRTGLERAVDPTQARPSVLVRHAIPST